MKLISEEKILQLKNKDEGGMKFRVRKREVSTQRFEDMNFLFQFDLILCKHCNMLHWLKVFCQNSISNCKFDNRKYLIGQ